MQAESNDSHTSAIERPLPQLLAGRRVQYMQWVWRPYGSAVNLDVAKARHVIAPIGRKRAPIAFVYHGCAGKPLSRRQVPKHDLATCLLRAVVPNRNELVVCGKTDSVSQFWGAVRLPNVPFRFEVDHLEAIAVGNFLRCQEKPLAPAEAVERLIGSIRTHQLPCVAMHNVEIAL